MTTEFGTTLRRWRDRLTPETVGLSAGGHRRAAGLRREELAMLSGISADYVTRLEQGRADKPSGQVVEALARALRLSHPEREHLFRTAGLVPPGRGTVPAYVTPSVQRLLDRLVGSPVAVSDAVWNLLLANPMYTALMGEQRGRERNGVWRHFLGPPGRVRHSPREVEALEALQVGALRAAATRYPADESLRRLIAELRTGSPRFAELWEAGIVGIDEPSKKTIDHPEVGELRLDCDVLSPVGCDLRIIVYTAEPGTRDAGRLADLAELVGERLRRSGIAMGVGAGPPYPE
ncbi:helix-turn-helix transcriptional regulator [Phytomonospora endophytica]|uniref:Transcriptional regulator with XRE-family HTH domain n=1 Tax=Phytomonospora endophytica TaxID=714109 RepID=A0A841FWB7_9ACTN|nr:helix-turn-helix transcriptional regulator [Phytomonospora endophytica]MBB6037627.1 transcriptional regulator with XRE-family HTH domain [Phytomonospora endophytica]